MSRAWNDKAFDESFERLIVGGRFNEDPSYYPRYKSRYEHLLMRYASMAPDRPQRILDVGGGQLALLCKAIWGDDAHATDIGGEHLAYLREHDIGTTSWDLCDDEQPFDSEFDFIFFSEVIEHLPIPGYLVLGRLQSALRPGGKIICSTPNLYRIRNVVYMITGARIFDNFRMPADDLPGMGHVLEYSLEHLRWQFQRAGFLDTDISLVQMHHRPNRIIHQLLYLLGSPLFLVPRWRDNLVAVASRPCST